MTHAGLAPRAPWRLRSGNRHQVLRPQARSPPAGHRDGAGCRQALLSFLVRSTGTLNSLGPLASSFLLPILPLSAHPAIKHYFITNYVPHIGGRVLRIRSCPQRELYAGVRQVNHHKAAPSVTREETNDPEAQTRVSGKRPLSRRLNAIEIKRQEDGGGIPNRTAKAPGCKAGLFGELGKAGPRVLRPVQS